MITLFFHLGILVISSFFGMATAATGKVGRPFFKFFYAATEIVLVILEKILWFVLYYGNRSTLCEKAVQLNRFS